MDERKGEKSIGDEKGVEQGEKEIKGSCEPTRECR